MSGWRELFDGASLAGWHAAPRLPVPRRPGGPTPERTPEELARAAGSSGSWRVVDGAIVAAQDPPGGGLGGYLVSDGVFGDIELEFDVHPDWPADTGVLLRATADGLRGYQVLLDFRKSGGLGGFYGNGIGGFHALAVAVDVERDAAGTPVRLVAEDPATSLEPITPDKPALLSHAATAEELIAAWRWDDWNTVRVRCVGASPVLTTWLNGVRIAELDTAAMRHPDYDAAAVRELLGPVGHLALEVHDHDARMGADRWGPDAVVRWRRLRVREVAAGD